MSTKTGLKTTLAVCFLIGAGWAYGDPVFVEDFDDADISDWTAGCLRLDHSGDTCFAPSAVNGGVELRGRGSCFSAPFNGVAATLSKAVALPNGKYSVSADITQATRHYNFCRGGTGGVSALRGIAGTGVRVNVNNCGFREEGPVTTAGCFTVAESEVNLELVTSAGDCADSTGFFDNIQISEAISVDVETEEACLWPPNHKMVAFENFTSGIVVNDLCDEDTGLVAVMCQSNQCDDASCAANPGENGDGHTTEDCYYDPSTDTLYARSERAGTEEDRIYTVTVVAGDASGNTADAIALVVTVPHNAPVDDCIKP